MSLFKRPDLESLMPVKRDPTTAAARRKEIHRRAAIAQGHAKTALTRLYGSAYRDLYQQALDAVYNECGPLPGDE